MSMTKPLGAILHAVCYLRMRFILSGDRNLRHNVKGKIIPAPTCFPRNSELIAEAAMGIWEFMLASHRDGNHDPSAAIWASPMHRLWQTYGTVEMRQHAYRLALSALDVFDILGREWIEEKDLLPYDWEFLPLVVRMGDWTSLYAADNRPERIADAIRALYSEEFSSSGSSSAS